MKNATRQVSTKLKLLINWQIWGPILRCLRASQREGFRWKENKSECVSKSYYFLKSNVFDNRKTSRMIAIYCFRTLVCIVLIVVIFITEHTLMQAPQVQEGGLILETSSSEKWRAKSAPSKTSFYTICPKFCTINSSASINCCVCRACTRDLRAEILGG